MTRSPRAWFVTNIAVVVAAVGLLGYSAWRAHTLDITHDEANTFIQFVLPFTYHEAMTQAPTAANHLLNTVAMKAGHDIAGPAHLALRWQSILAHVLYLAVSLLWLRRFRNAWVLACGFAVLNVNPYLLDFFSVARGYGLACAFTLTSVYCLFRLVEEGRWGFGALAYLFGALAVLANFSLLHYYVALVGAFNVYVLCTAPRTRAKFVEWVCKRNVPTLVFSADLAAIIYRPLKNLLAQRQLYFGGKTGFWVDTVRSEIYGYLYDYRDPAIAMPDIASRVLEFFGRPALPSLAARSAIEWLVVGVLGLALTIAIGGILWRRFRGMKTPMPYAIALLVVPALSTIVLFEWRGTLLLILRTGLFFQVLFAVTLVLVIAAGLRSVRGVRWLTAPLAALLALVMVGHALGRMNLSSTLDWRHQSRTQQMLADMNADRKTRHAGKEFVSLGADWRLEPSVHFYKLTGDFGWLQWAQFNVWQEMKPTPYDYWYCYQGDVERLPNPTDPLHEYVDPNFWNSTPPVLRVLRPSPQ